MTYMARLTGCSDRNILLKCNLFWEFNFLLKARLKLQREHFFFTNFLKIWNGYILIFYRFSANCVYSSVQWNKKCGWRKRVKKHQSGNVINGIIKTMFWSLVTLIAIFMRYQNSPEAMSVRKATVSGYTQIGLFQGVGKMFWKNI